MVGRSRLVFVVPTFLEIGDHTVLFCLDSVIVFLNSSMLKYYTEDKEH